MNPRSGESVLKGLADSLFVIVVVAFVDIDAVVIVADVAFCFIVLVPVRVAKNDRFKEN